MIDYSDGDAFGSFSMFPADEYFFDTAFDDSVYEELAQPCYEDADVAPLLLPGLNVEHDRTMSIYHLLKAYGEASSGPASAAELARVILARLREKASPIGATMERLAYHLLPQQSDPQSEFLTAESAKSHALALQAFYEITPYGRLAHFVANAAAHESVPRNAAQVRIVDLDVGEGIQWPPLLAALGPHRSIRITCIDAEDENSNRFARTRERLLAFARTMRLDLRVDSSSVDGFFLGEKREFLVFNCMTGLPHMGTTSTNKNRSRLCDFAKMASDKIVSSGRRGVLIYGSGGTNASAYSDAHLLWSHAMFESMESHFMSTVSTNLSLARTAMECLFVGPACAGGCGADAVDVSGLEGLSMGKNSAMEAEEIVRRSGGGEQYGLRIGDGENRNEIALEWRGIPLVRVCAWR